MRFVFTDGWNSSWHVLFGMMAYYNLFIILLFAYYQFILKYDFNSAIDFAEFLAGYMLMWAFYSASAASAPSDQKVEEPEEPEEPEEANLKEARRLVAKLSVLLTPSNRRRNYTRRSYTIVSSLSG